MRSFIPVLLLAFLVDVATPAPFKTEVEESKKDLVQQNLVPSLTEDKDLITNAVEDAEGEEEDAERTKKSPTTVCVEVQPASPYDKPYTVCEPVHGVSNSKYGSAPPAGYSTPAQGSSGYQAPAQASAGYQAPSQSGYQAPAAHKPASAPAYGSASAQAYTAPSSGGYSAPAASAPAYGQAPAAQQYHAPSHYGAAPAYSSAPAYGAAQAQYGSAQAHYGAAQAQYGPAAAQYGSAPAQYGSAPSHYASAPAYGPAPAHYGSAAAQYAAPAHAYGQPKPAPAYGGSAGYKDAEDDAEKLYEEAESLALADPEDVVDPLAVDDENLGSFLLKKKKKLLLKGGYGAGGYGRSAAAGYAAGYAPAPAYGIAPSFVVASQVGGYGQPQYQAPYTQAATYGSPAGPAAAAPAYSSPSAPVYSAPSAPAYSVPSAAYSVPSAPVYSSPSAPVYSSPPAAPVYSSPPSAPVYSAPAPVYPAPQVSYTTYAAQPPCATNYLFSCSPSVRPVPCSQSYLPPQMSLTAYPAPAAQYTAPAPVYTAPAAQYGAPAPVAYGAKKSTGYREANEEASSSAAADAKNERSSGNSEDGPVLQPVATMASEKMMKHEKMKMDTIARMNEIAEKNMKTIEAPSAPSAPSAPPPPPMPPVPLAASLAPSAPSKSPAPSGLANPEDGQAPKADRNMNFVPYMRPQWQY